MAGLGKYQIVLLTVAVAILTTFYLFSREVRRGVMTRVDFDTTVRLQDKIPARFDELWDDGAILIDPIVSSFLVMVATAFAFFRPHKKRLRFGALLIPVAFLLLTMAEVYGKTILPHPGPPFFMVKHPTTIFPRFMVIEPYSFPSGHASRSTFLALIFLFLVWPKLKEQRSKILAAMLVGAYVLFIYVGRVYLGQHWLSDVVGGILLGTATGFLGGLFLL